jgi:CheY-specific phosphatase CheX
MKADFVNAFLNPVVETWRAKLSVDVTFREAEPISGVFTTDELSAVIAVSGRVEGNVFYEFPDATSLALAGAIMGTEKHDLDAEVFTVIQRFVEAITASIPDALGRSGFRSQVTAPVLLARGAAVTVTHPQIWAHFDSQLGPMGVRVSVREVVAS